MCSLLMKRLEMNSFCILKMLRYSAFLRQLQNILESHMENNRGWEQSEVDTGRYKNSLVHMYCNSLAALQGCAAPAQFSRSTV
jgi:hypothetical protein